MMWSLLLSRVGDRALLLLPSLCDIFLHTILFFFFNSIQKLAGIRCYFGCFIRELLFLSSRAAHVVQVSNRELRLIRA